MAFLKQITCGAVRRERSLIFRSETEGTPDISSRISVSQFVHGAVLRLGRKRMVLGEWIRRSHWTLISSAWLPSRVKFFPLDEWNGKPWEPDAFCSQDHDDVDVTISIFSFGSKILRVLYTESVHVYSTYY